jgi:uncharacterized protein YdeI (YjbR/CyaY-like superfamily)
MAQDLPILSFENVAALRAWLLVNHATSAGILVRIFKGRSGAASVSFEDLLDEGLCFGWSESTRLPGDSSYYLQKFTPRKTRGTASPRNRSHAARLIEEGRMTPAGLLALGSDAPGVSGNEATSFRE